jgi:hypothetical protein
LLTSNLYAFLFSLICATSEAIGYIYDMDLKLGLYCKGRTWDKTFEPKTTLSTS